MNARAAVFPLLAALAAGTGVGGYSAPCRAQSQEELDRARSAFRQGLSLEAAGNWAAALAKFQEVAQVKLTPQVRFHIARCKEHLGRLNEALGDYRLAEYEAQQQELQELPAIAQAREQLESRVPTLIITRGAGAEMARISLDGVEIGERQLGQPVAVDPGPHTIVARLPGDLQFEETVSVQEEERKEVALVAPPELAERAAAAAESAPQSTTSPAEDRPADSDDNVLPWVVGGVGVAGLAASGVFFVLRNGAESDLDDVCRGNVCPRSAEDTQSRGELYSTLSVVGLGVGVVGLGVATYLLLTDGSGDAAAETARRSPPILVDVAVSEQSQGLRIHGTF